MNAKPSTRLGRDAGFTTTHWTQVLAAAKTQSLEAEEAMEQLCRRYWYPLYAFARRKGASHHDAEDLTQQFFAGRVVTKRAFQGINPKLGKFRTWLLNGFQNFMHNEWAKQHAEKRGGQASHLSLDMRDGEPRYMAEPSDEATPEQFYDRAWAITLLGQAFAQLRARYEEEGKKEIYTELSAFLPGTQQVPSYAETALKLGLSEAALKMRVSRLRQELGRLVNAEIRILVSNPDEVQEELHYLITVIGS